MRCAPQHRGNLTGIGFRPRINAAAEGAETEDAPRAQRCQHGGVPHFQWRVCVCGSQLNRRRMGYGQKPRSARGSVSCPVYVVIPEGFTREVDTELRRL